VKSLTVRLYINFIDLSLSCLQRAVLVPREALMAIQDYVRSIAATDTVSKDQVFRFLEMQFARADRNHDGQLDADELAAFVQAVARPDADQR
jgi:hypothetical protein